MPFLQRLKATLHQMTRLIRPLIIPLRILPTALRRDHRSYPARPHRRLRPVRIIPPDPPADTPPQSPQSPPPPACSPPQFPPLPPYEPASCARPQPDAVSYSAPFCPPYGMIAAHCPCAVLMRLDIAGVNHQPLKVAIIGHGGQQLAPLAALLPASEARSRRRQYHRPGRSWPHLPLFCQRP